MNFLSLRAQAIAPYTAGEQPADKQYVKLNTNENPYPPSPRVKEVLRAFEAEKLRLYPRPDADGLRAAIARAEGVEEGNVFCGNGSDEVLALSFPAFFDEGGKPACFADLTYSFYEVFAAFFGVKTHIVPLKADFSFDLAAMQAADCAGYYLCNPNAPTGIALPLSAVEHFVASVGERVVIADEAYMDFYGQSAVPLTKKYKNLLVVKTFSKSYSLAGIRCGYAVGDEALIGGLFRMKDCFNSYPVDAVAQAVSIPIPWTPSRRRSAPRRWKIRSTAIRRRRSSKGSAPVSAKRCSLSASPCPNRARTSSLREEQRKAAANSTAP